MNFDAKIREAVRENNQGVDQIDLIRKQTNWETFHKNPQWSLKEVPRNGQDNYSDDLYARNRW